MDRAYYRSPVGFLVIEGDSRGISLLNFLDDDQKASQPVPSSLKSCFSQLDEYFIGKRKNFDLRFVLEGTDFQKRVWKELTNIPFGETVSYQDIARAVKNEKAVRAVGSANGKNPVAIMIPCHRVIGSNGKLVGFGGGLWRKKWLLEHERKNS